MFCSVVIGVMVTFNDPYTPTPCAAGDDIQLQATIMKADITLPDRFTGIIIIEYNRPIIGRLE